MGAIFADQGAHGAVLNGKVTSTTPGTAVPLSSVNVGVHSVVLYALAANTNDIYLGNSGVSSANGLRLIKGDSITVVVSNLALLFMDVQTSGDGLTYLAT